MAGLGLAHVFRNLPLMLAMCVSRGYYYDMTTTKGHTMELFENTHSGSVCCRKHLGYEATAGFTAKPNAKSVKTAFGTVRKMNDAQVAEWLELVSSMWASGCESCK